MEYSLLQMRIPAMKARGMAMLESLNRQYPGEPTGAQRAGSPLFADGRTPAGLDLLRQMARDDVPAGQGRRSGSPMSSMPVGPVAALQGT